MTDSKAALIELLNGILSTCPADFDPLVEEAIAAIDDGNTTILDVGMHLGQGLMETRDS